MLITLNGNTAGINFDLSIATMVINTVGGAPIVNTEDYVNASYAIIRRSGYVESGTLRIRGRGNYTWSLPKKPYRLNFDVKSSPMGLTANEKNWALLANHDDPRKIANILGFTLGSWLNGLTWTPEFELLELTLNGDYVGLYQLTDLVRVETHRVPGTPATKTSLNGTWLAEISRRYVSEGVPGFTTTNDVMIQYDTPEVDLESSDPQTVIAAEYFRDYIQSFENALYGGTWLDTETGYATFINMHSFIDWWLINEFGSNQDSDFESSCKFWREPIVDGGKLHMGPIWDFGISFGNVVNFAHPPTGWWTFPGTWIERMLDDPTFKELALERWDYILSILNDFSYQVDKYMNMQADAIARDETRWGSSHINMYNEIAFIKNWINTRASWITTYLPSAGA